MEKRIKPKKTKEEILEIIVVIILGVTALSTAWASWIGSLHGGNQSTNYTDSNNLSARGNSDFNDASQLLSQDMMVWNDISELRIDYSYAKDKNNKDDMEKYEWKLNQIYADNVSETLQTAIDWADSQEEYASPFDMPDFVESYFTEANQELEQAQEIFEQGKKDNANGDTYGLVTVVYSVVLFLLGIVGTFKNLTNRYVIVGISLVAFVSITIFMFTIPLPTGFSLASFFGG